MAEIKLTKKQRGFVRDYILTENGTQSVYKNYNVTTLSSATSIACENLTKPYIIEAIEIEKKKLADRIPDNLLEERHLELLNKRDTAVIDGQLIDKGVDTNAVKAGLDMAYKLKGAYAAEKNINLNLDVGNSILDPKLKAISDEYTKKVMEALKKDE